MAIKVFEGLEFLNEGLVLIFKHSHTIFKTFDIFFLLPATLPGSFPGTNTRQMTTGTTSQHNPEWLQGHLSPPFTQSTANQSEESYTKLPTKRTLVLSEPNGKQNWKTFLIIEERFFWKNLQCTEPYTKGNNYSEITTVNNLVLWLLKANCKRSVYTLRLRL